MSHALGWIQDIPDARDYILDDNADIAMACGLPWLPSTWMVSTGPPSKVDLSEHCSPIENQGSLGSCTANACVGLVEFLERRSRKKHLDASRLFNYKVSRTLHGWTGDTGMYIRTAMKALVVFGLPPEKHWPYVIADFDKEPTPFCYAYAQSFRTLRYYRLDVTGRSRQKVLDLMRLCISRAWPIVFGFLVYNFGNDAGEFVLPEAGKSPHGGHAIMAMGYDDDRVIGSSTGAFRIRNSWGTGWGDRGYGWLPYDYVLRNLSSDFWTIFSQSYFLD